MPNLLLVGIMLWCIAFTNGPVVMRLVVNNNPSIVIWVRISSVSYFDHFWNFSFRLSGPMGFWGPHRWSNHSASHLRKSLPRKHLDSWSNGTMFVPGADARRRTWRLEKWYFGAIRVGRYGWSKCSKVRIDVALRENLRLIFHNRLEVNDRVDPFVAIYDPPAASRVGNATHLRWKGFLPPSFVQSVIDTSMWVILAVTLLK